MMNRYLVVAVPLVNVWSPLETQEPPLIPTAHTKRDIEGWTVHIDDRLLVDADKKLGDHALRILANRLDDIKHVVPAPFPGTCRYTTREHTKCE